jgi:PAS domain-containing protein
LRIGAREARRSAAEETLDRMPFGIILLDAGGRVLFLNRADEALVVAVDGLAVSSGTLRAAGPRDTAALRRLISEAFATAIEKRERRRCDAAAAPGAAAAAQRAGYAGPAAPGSAEPSH